VRAKKLQRLADRRVPALTRVTVAAIRDGRSKIDRKHLARAIARGGLGDLKLALPTLATHVLLRKADVEDEFADSLAGVFADSAQFAVALAPQFDLVDRNAVQFARARAGKFFNDMDATLLDNARQAVAFGMENGLTVDQTANYIADTAYLPPRAANAVQNYFSGLIGRLNQGDDIAEAARAMGADRALAPTKFLDATNIDTLVGRYADRWTEYTADVTAHTMTIEASNEGLLDGWNQAAQAGLFDASQATKQWMATDDDITCPECSELDGTEADFPDGTFDSGDSVPPAHPSCRCTVVLITEHGSEMPADDLSEE